MPRLGLPADLFGAFRHHQLMPVGIGRDHHDVVDLTVNAGLHDIVCAESPVDEDAFDLDAVSVKEGNHLLERLAVDLAALIYEVRDRHAGIHIDGVDVTDDRSAVMRLVRAILTQVGLLNLAVVVGAVDGNPCFGNALLPAMLQPADLEITFLLIRHE